MMFFVFTPEESASSAVREEHASSFNSERYSVPQLSEVWERHCHKEDGVKPRYKYFLPISVAII